MKKNKRQKKLKLVEINISQENLVKLLELQGDLGLILRHDFNSKWYQVQTSLFLINRTLTDIFDSKTKRNFEEKRKRIDRWINRADRSLIEALRIIESLFPDIDDDQSDILISNPKWIVDDICSFRNDVSVIFDDKNWRTLEIVYPENILKAIINEFITNAIKHNSNIKCELFVSWHLDAANFVFELHDNGKGIIPGLMESITPIGGVLESINESGNRATGLRLMNRIIRASNGNLFVSRSQLLGGTQIFFSLPISAYYKKGHIYESK